jgi:hypothetical protein
MSDMDKRVTVRLTNEETELLNSIVEENQSTITETIRMALRMMAKKKFKVINLRDLVDSLEEEYIIRRFK